MPTLVHRQTVDLSAYPDLVVIYLGLRVNALTGLKTAFGLGPQINAAVAPNPTASSSTSPSSIPSSLPTSACANTGAT